MGGKPDGFDRLQKMRPCDELSNHDMLKYPMTWRSFWADLIVILLRPFIGPILIFSGLYTILHWYGYSTWMDLSLPDAEWWAEWAGRAFAGELLVALTLGIGMVASGCWLLIRGMRPIV
jgi:hypothetical protein